MLTANCRLINIEINQPTSPEELPIHGELGEQMQLSIQSETQPGLFRLEGKRLRLLRPLDRDDVRLKNT